MRAFLASHIAVATHLLVVALSVTLGAWVAHDGKQEVVQMLKETLEAQVRTLNDLAVMTGHNGADATTASIIPDCSRRNEFDELLGRLGSLTGRELIDLQRLYENCGPFYAKRKALMVSELEREYETAQTTLSMLKVLEDVPLWETKLAGWKEVITLEANRSVYLREQTDIQEDIITTLIAGGKDGEITALVLRGQELSQLLSVVDQQITALRTKLSP